jgi:TPR repeat protein
MKRMTCAVCIGFGLFDMSVSAAAPNELYDEALALYERGHYRAALVALEDAARTGHVRAQEMAGMMHLAGPGLYGSQVARDPEAAHAWLTRAAQGGSLAARRLVCEGVAAAGDDCTVDFRASSAEVLR